MTDALAKTSRVIVVECVLRSWLLGVLYCIVLYFSSRTVGKMFFFSFSFSFSFSFFLFLVTLSSRELQGALTIKVEV
jgi:hypothetical protein